MASEVRLYDLVNLAVGTPEPGAVNFTVLHQLLHALLGKLKLGDETTNVSLPIEATKNTTAAPGAASGASHALQQRINNIELRIQQLDSMPKLDQLAAGAATANDVWKLIQLQRRTDGTEEGVNKLAELVTELTNKFKSLQDENNAMKGKLKSLEEDSSKSGEIKGIVDRMSDLEGKIGLMVTADDLQNMLRSFVSWQVLEDALKGLRTSYEEQQAQLEELWKQRNIPVASEIVQTDSRASSRAGPSNDVLDLMERLGSLGELHEVLQGRVQILENDMPNKVDRSELAGLGIPEEFLTKMDETRNLVNDLLGMREKDVESLRLATEMISQLRTDVDRLRKVSENLLDDSQLKQKLLDELSESVTTLKEKKADRSWALEQLDYKADKLELDKKANVAQLDTAFGKVNTEISEMQEKLNELEKYWQEGFVRLEEVVETKVNKQELTALKDYVDARLKALNAKIGKVGVSGPAPDQEGTAAGVKMPMLTHCISCDRPVDMRSYSPPPHLPQPPMPATRSARPFNAYELDSLRQNARREFEKSGLPLPRTEAELFDYYAGPRPCGGGHTTTHPHHRISRVSHLVNVAAGIIPQEEAVYYDFYRDENEVKGTDGHIYKSRNSDRLPQVDVRRSQGKQAGGQEYQSQGARPTSSGRMRRPMSAVGDAAPADAPTRDRPRSSRGGNQAKVAFSDGDRATTPKETHRQVPPTTPDVLTGRQDTDLSAADVTVVPSAATTEGVPEEL